MRLPLIALAIAAIALPSAHPPGGRQGESATHAVAGYQSARSGQYPSLKVTGNASLTTNSTTFDWRLKGVVTPVQNEGECASDWAISAAGAVEGLWAIQHKVLISLSAQKLIDCEKRRSMGCRGGFPEDALSYIQASGAVSSAAYPYTARDGMCKTTAPVVAKIRGMQSQTGDAALLNMLLSHGPVSVVVNASWVPSYRGGVVRCTSRSLEVAALLVGVEDLNGFPVWIVKFPFGTSFGDHGYAYISREQGNDCGISSHAFVPLPLP